MGMVEHPKKSIIVQKPSFVPKCEVCNGVPVYHISYRDPDTNHNVPFIKGTQTRFPNDSVWACENDLTAATAILFRRNNLGGIV